MSFTSTTRPNAVRSRARRALVRRRRATLAGLAAVVVLAALVVVVRRDDVPAPLEEEDLRGTPQWALAEYGNPDAPKFEKRNIVEIDFLDRSMLVHRHAAPHFLRLARLFEARAPEYAELVAAGELDDWSYLNRPVRGGTAKSNHAFGLAIDINALQNVVGTSGNIPAEVIAQWEIEGGAWGGEFSNPDPMHFETHLTPEEIRERYNPDGTPRPEYLEELVGG